MNGYSNNLILDSKGIFYLIHPQENNIYRNNITGIINNFESQKINNIIINLLNKLKIIYFNDKNINYIKNNNFNEIEIYISKIKTKYFDILPNYIIKLLLYSIKYNCTSQIILILSFYLFNFDYNEIIISNKIDNKFNNINNNYNSSLYLLYNILEYYISNITIPNNIIDKIILDNNLNKNTDINTNIKININISKFLKNKNIFKKISESLNINNFNINKVINSYYNINYIFNKFIINNPITMKIVDKINIIDISSNPFNNIIRCFLHIYPYYGYIDNNIFYDYTGFKYNIKNITIINCNKCFISYINKNIYYIGNDLFIDLICPNVIDENIICYVLFSNININTLKKNNNTIFNSIINKYKNIYPLYYKLISNDDIKYHILHINNNFI